MARWTTTSAEERRAAATQEEAACTRCNGRGGWQEERSGYPGMPAAYTVDVWVVCLCVQKRQARDYLARVWPELTDVRQLPHDADVTARLSMSVWVTAPWLTIAPDLRAAVLEVHRRRPAWRVVAYRDVELPALMHADRTARSFGDRDVERLDEEAELIVIRTGFAAGKNAGIADGISTLIASRVDRPGQAIWIIDEPRRPLARGYIGWSDGLAEALGRLDHDVWGVE